MQTVMANTCLVEDVSPEDLLLSINEKMPCALCSRSTEMSCWEHGFLESAKNIHTMLIPRNSLNNAVLLLLLA